ncbi:MAG: AAA family ATPase [Bacteroidales bacterium]|nr:AAA family ATPase [Bacteroidales bacterium]MDY4562516.1 AAA family ATPase [Candidatus Cryptobacteroides sp.]MDY6171374.1 AAA family ATPase [Candidatus Cryptobacteroides sp.]
MDTLFRKHDRLLANTSMDIVRDQMNQIHWNAQIISIMGPKGVGKSTLLRQYVKRNYQIGDRKALYCSADSVDFSTRTLVELAEQFFINGGELLIVDEIHKYKPGTSDWSKEVKEIYELFPKLKLIVSGSSLLKLKEGDADLSRRAIKYTMPGLSFREALRFYHGLDFPKWTLEDILTHPFDLWEMVTSKCKPVVHFKEYLEKGYYPFLLEGEGEYFTRIEQVVNYIIETELPQICKVDVANIRKLQALVKLIAEEVPFELNANKIAGSMEIGRDTVVEYLKYLGDAKILNLLYSDRKKTGKLSKPDKVYLENPNLLYAIAPDKVEIGTARESFAINSLSESHLVEYGKAHGDFKIDSKYTFEIGGRSKDFSQIAGIPDSYIFADDWDMPDGAKLPLWMLGFLY